MIGRANLAIEVLDETGENLRNLCTRKGRELEAACLTPLPIAFGDFIATPKDIVVMVLHERWTVG